MYICRDRLARKSTDLVQPIAANDKGCTDTERASPCILGRLKYIEKEALVVDQTLRGQQIVLNRIRIVIKLWRLNHRNLRIRKQSNRALQEIAPRSKIRIQHHNNRALGLPSSNRDTLVLASSLSL